MSFLSFGVKNPFRSKLRTFFLIGLLTIGILAVTVSTTSSCLATQLLGATYTSGGADIILQGDDYLSMNNLNKVRSINGIREAVGVSSYYVNFTNQTYTFKGFVNDKINDDIDIAGIGHIKLVDGEFYTDSRYEILITKQIANETSKKVGDIFSTSEICSVLMPLSKAGGGMRINQTHSSTDFKIVGIIDNIQGIDGIMPVQTVNNLLYSSSDLKFNSISIKTIESQRKQVKNTLNQTYPQFTILEGDAILNNLKSLFLYLSLFLIGIGVIIMMIATLKSVGERTREIGVLKAIGWSNKRVMGLILIESFVQLLLAWILGLIIILIAILYLHMEVNICTILEENIPTLIYIFSVSFTLSLLIPLLGSLLPLVRVSRLKPTEALRYE